MGFFAEQSFFLKLLTEAPGAAGLGLELDPDEESPAPDFLDVTTLDRPELFEVVGPLLDSVLDEFFVLEDTQGFSSYRAGHGIAAEGGAVFAGFENAQDIPRRQSGRDRITASPQRLADDHHVGLDALMFTGEYLPSATQPRLDLVGDEQDIVHSAKLLGRLEIAGGRDEDPGLGLDGLDKKGRGVGRDGLPQGIDIAVRDDHEPGCKRSEIVPVEGFGGEADDRYGPAVEIIGAGDNFRPVLGNSLFLICPLTGGLDGRFDRLGAGVHGQHHLVSGQVAELLGQERPLIIPEGPSRQRQTLGLLLDDLDDPGMAVAMVDGRMATQEVEVLVALDIPGPDPLALGQDGIQRVIVVGRVDIFELDKIPSVHFLLLAVRNSRLFLNERSIWRRGWDSNPRYALRRTHAFQACSLSHSDTSPCRRKAA